MANLAYVRVSSADQNEMRQVEAIKAHNIDKWFLEKISGKDLQRPQLQAMLDYMRENDVVYVHDLSRLARSTKDLLSLLDLMRCKKVELVSLKESLDTSTPAGKLMVTVISAINEFERSNLLERQAEGIAIAKASGKYKGRSRIKVKNFDEYYSLYMSRKISKAGLAKHLGVSRPTIDRLIREHEEKLQKQQEKKMVPGQLSIDWDPDFTKVTEEEKKRLKKSDIEMKNGDYISEEEFWK